MDSIETLCTTEDLIKLGEGRYELEKGVIRQMAPAGEEHGIVTARIIRRIVESSDELEGGDVLPGFKCSVREIFE